MNKKLTTIATTIAAVITATTITTASLVASATPIAEEKNKTAAAVSMKTQQLIVETPEAHELQMGERDAYTVTAKPTPDDAKAYAASKLSAGDYNCLVLLWNKESGWRFDAENKSSGAYGIPQALPGSKMASAGADWRVNYRTQVDWGLGYIKNRYGSACNAWAHSQANNWY